MRSHLPFAAILPLVLTIASSALANDETNPWICVQGSSLARPVPFEQGKSLLARGALAEAAVAFGAFSRDFPTDLRAPRAFVDAATINMGLGNLDLSSAEWNLQTFENTFVPVDLDLWAEMAFKLIDGFTDRNDRNSALALLHRTLIVAEEWSGEARKKKTADLQTLREIEIGVRGRLAHFYSRIGDHRGADAEYARIQKLTPELGVWPGKKPPRNTAKFPETIELIAKSFYYVAEQKRFEAERIPLPPYIGNGDRASVLKFVEGPGGKWYKAREYAVKEANRLYAFVLGVELPKPEPPKPPPPPPTDGTMIGLVGGDPNAPEYPSPLDPDSDNYPGASPPSPTWAIAAAERVGRLWSSFVSESRRMPIPQEWRPAGLVPGTDLTWEEVKGEFIDYVDSPSEVQKQQAKHAYQYCLDLSVKQRIVNEHTDACIRWLSKNYGAEYHYGDEFMPQGEFFALGSFTRPADLPKFTH